MSDPEGLEALLASISHGEEAALSRLYEATSAWVYGLILRLVGDAGAAEEVALDVYLKVWERAGQFAPGKGSANAWIVGIARNAAIDRLRASRAARRSARWVPIDDAAGAAPGRDPSPEGVQLRDERLAAVLAGLRGLPQRQRRALELAFFEGLSHTEVAVAMAEPLGTVKTHIRLGMAKLRRLLEPWDENE